MWPFSNFQYGFRSSWSTEDLLIGFSERMTRAFNKSGAAQAGGLDKLKAFEN